MRFKKLLSLALIGIFAITGALMLGGCGDKKAEVKPESVKELEAIMESSMLQDFRLTSTVDVTAEYGAGQSYNLTATSYISNDTDNQIVFTELPIGSSEYNLYTWMNNGNCYWGGDMVGLLPNSITNGASCVYSEGTRAYDFTINPKNLVGYYDYFWGNGAKITVETEQLTGNKVITSENSMRIAGVTDIEMVTTFVYNETQIVSITQDLTSTASTSYNGTTYTSSSIEHIVVEFDYVEQNLEVPIDIKAQESEAHYADVDLLLAQYGLVSGM